jgi:murein DD-endopeptidase MepM/ murein hydrolase activator NlpD
MVAQSPAPDDEAYFVPPRRPASGRHRRPKNSGAPAYLTAATLAAFAVGGVNVPGAIGASRDPGSSYEPVAATTQPKRRTVSAAELRTRVAEQQAARATRLRATKAEADRLAAVAKERAEKRAAEARAKARPRWVAPLLNYGMSAGFGEASYLWSHVHTGQDFTAPAGTPIRAVGDGVIISAGWDGSYGQKIVIEHSDGTHTWYAHMSSFVRTSGPVKAGDVIGRVGSTGNATGNHLHLEVRPGGGDPINPLPWLRAHGVRV